MNEKFETWYEENCEYLFVKFTGVLMEYFGNLRAFAMEVFIETFPDPDPMPA
jgi:hypothetical protein